MIKSDYNVIKNTNEILYIKYEYIHHRLPRFIGGKMIHFTRIYDDSKFDIQIFLKNSLFHHNSSAAFICNKKPSYYFNGIGYRYEDWLELPERIREVRNEKLELI